MRVVGTERLELVPVGSANAHALWAILQQPDLREFQEIPRTTLEEFERQVRSRPTRLVPGATGRFEWIVRERGSSADLGWISLRINERTREHGELGYSLIASARGSGFATEALTALVDYAFTATDLAELHACIVPENASSRAVLDRVGFVNSRVIRGGAMVRNRRVDIILFLFTRALHSRRRRDRIAG